VLLAIGAAVLFAINGNVSKVALQNGISSLELVSMRSAGTALILMVITALTNPGALRVSRRELGFLALYGLTGIAWSSGSTSWRSSGCPSASPCCSSTPRR
jgi:hypothetical protein